MIILDLYFVFFKIGLFSVGGGLATIPFLQKIVVEQFGWITSSDLLDIIAIAESTPGAIGVNAATFVGYKTADILGSIVAVLGLITPSIIIIIIIAHYFKKFREQKIVQSGFYGIRPVVAGLIGAAGFEVAKIALVNMDKYNISGNIVDLINIKATLICVLTIWAIAKCDKHPIVYIAAGAVLGILFKL
ncbi:MAG: chromate transporter [Cellulosilyticaceae bacterium]